MGHYEAPIREPIIIGNKSYHDISVDVAAPIEGKANKLWWISFTIALIAFLWGVGAIVYTIGTGIGVWGLNNKINWAWDITNFVWWVGIGHAGTLISAVLLLFRQKWRMGINRSAEAMTIFAVVQAGLFPLIHMGRIWDGFYVLPIPNQLGSLWVNFNSPLLWDVFAISTYLSVSLVFWYTGLLPDFAMIRDRATKPFQKKIYSLLSFGWTGRAKDWQRFEEVSLVLAGLATPLVLSVHTIVSFDFATSVIPGWHSTVYPPYFVAGAVFSGFAMVQTLLLIMRKVSNLEAYITRVHIENMNKVILVTGGIVTVAYLSELFVGWYTGSSYEDFVYLSVGAATGPYWWAFWALITCNAIIPQLLWIKKIRTNYIWTFIIAIFINIGMWFERFDIIVINLSRGHLPSTWTQFSPTFVDIGIFIGTLGFFFVLFLLYARTFPVIAQAEIKSILKSSGDNFKRERDNPEAVKKVAKSKPAVSKSKPTTSKSDNKEDKTSNLLQSLGTFDKSKQKPDDLKKVKGIGPVMEKTLNKIGIYSFDQVSKMTNKEYDLLDSITGSFPGRAQRDDWAGQAKKLKS
jgi:molybdopterin-containing oxidoreductase family membrane subunit